MSLSKLQDTINNKFLYTKKAEPVIKLQINFIYNVKKNKMLKNSETVKTIYENYKCC